jgi:hypothetical protein
MRLFATQSLALLWLLAGVSSAAAQDTLSAPRPYGYVQVRESWRESDGPSAGINRVRLGLQGRLPNQFSYRAAIEYASASNPALPAAVALRDGFIRWQKAQWAITGGQFKTPFSREFLTSLPLLETLDRSAVVDTLATKRDVGLQVAYVHSAAFEMAVGAFNGEGQNIFANRDQESMVVGRAVVRPIAMVTLAGNAATYAGDSVRYGGDASIESHGAVVRAEYIGQHVRDRERDENGWYLLGAYRALQWLQLVARHEDFLRPHLGEARRTTASLLGANIEFPAARTRLTIEGMGRRTGSPRQTVMSLRAQLQVLF